MHGCDRCLQRVGADIARRERKLNQCNTFIDEIPIPERAVLIVQQHHFARG